MSSIRWGIGALALLIARAASAGGAVTGHVELSFAKDQGAMLFVRVDALKSGSPACDVNGAWTYVLPQVSDTDKRICAMPVAAEMSGQTVVLGGTGGCADFGSIESLNSADLKH
jgi:hypothetical protein